MSDTPKATGLAACRVYIAGRFEERARLRAERARIRDAGVECVCGWLDHAEDVPSFSPDFTAAFAAQEKWRDLDDVAASDLLILDHTTGDGGKGRYIEMGYAIARRKAVWLVGSCSSVFTADVQTFETWSEAHTALLIFKRTHAQAAHEGDIPAAELDAILARAEAASKEPWRTQVTSNGGRLLVRGNELPIKDRHPQSHLQIVPAEDCEFIAAARTDIPRLVRALRGRK